MNFAIRQQTIIWDDDDAHEFSAPICTAVIFKIDNYNDLIWNDLFILKWGTYRGYLCFQVQPTTKVFVTWFAPVLVFIHFYLRIYLNGHIIQSLWDKLTCPFTENVETTLAFPSKWRIINNTNTLYWQGKSSLKSTV